MFKRVCLSLLAMSAAIATANAQEVTLRAVSAFQEGTAFSRPFEFFLKEVAEKGKGVIRIDFIGGPRAMPPLEVGNAVRSGVIDIANVTSNFYSNLLPEAQALQLSSKSYADLRKNGGWDLLNKLHQEKMNAFYLGNHGKGINYHLYLTKEMNGIDMTGLTIRVTPVYRPFFTERGANLVNTPPGEVFTALERGVIQGYGWPGVGVFDLGWQDRTKFRVDPGFYNVEVGLLVNLPKWKSLTDAQRKVLQDAAIAMEQQQARDNPGFVRDEFARQEKAGIKTISLTGADRDAWEKKAKETYWAEIARVAPNQVKELRRLLVDE